MQSGWWWLRDPEELEAVTRALHPRGIREKALHKHLTKHKEFLREVCLRSSTGESAQSPPGVWGDAALSPLGASRVSLQSPDFSLRSQLRGLLLLSLS